MSEPTRRSVEQFRFEGDGRIPNSQLPLLLYRQAFAADAGPEVAEARFAGNGWLGSWRDGIYPFHHFHSTSHEVLAIVAGRASVTFGGSAGRRVAVAAGDVVVIPAGVGHKNDGSDGLLVVGAYPDGMDWDLQRGDPGVYERCRARIAEVPLPLTDPVDGAAGELPRLWRAAV